MPKNKNIWNLINLGLSIVSIVVGLFAQTKDNEMMKQEIIEELKQQNLN